MGTVGWLLVVGGRGSCPDRRSAARNGPDCQIAVSLHGCITTHKTVKMTPGFGARCPMLFGDSERSCVNFPRPRLCCLGRLTATVHCRSRASRGKDHRYSRARKVRIHRGSRMNVAHRKERGFRLPSACEARASQPRQIDMGTRIGRLNSSALNPLATANAKESRVDAEFRTKRETPSVMQSDRLENGGKSPSCHIARSAGLSKNKPQRWSSAKLSRARKTRLETVRSTTNHSQQESRTDRPKRDKRITETP